MSNGLDYHRSRYILMRHDPEARNHAYLYEYARVIETIGPLASGDSVDIVQCVGPSTGDESADFVANYQLGRLQSGMEGRSQIVFRFYHQAREEAQRTAQLLQAWRLVDKTDQEERNNVPG